MFDREEERSGERADMPLIRCIDEKPFGFHSFGKNGCDVVVAVATIADHFTPTFASNTIAQKVDFTRGFGRSIGHELYRQSETSVLVPHEIA